MYLYEMHCHTSETSRCGRASAAENVRFYKERGFDGLCITDHFLNGNTTVDRTLCWAEQVDSFFGGYRAAVAEGDKLGLKVFFGFEYSFHGTDFLIYGVGEQWLLRHPECLGWKTGEFCNRVRAAGGYVVQAHPYREADYIEMIRLMPRCVDGVETLNACRTDFENTMAARYAEAYSLTPFAGSDNHGAARIKADRLAALGFETPKATLAEVIAAVRCGEHQLVEIPMRKNEEI